MAQAIVSTVGMPNRNDHVLSTLPTLAGSRSGRMLRTQGA
jgi:hypothetical protein